MGAYVPLIHWDEEPLTEVYDFSQQLNHRLKEASETLNAYDKPQGLWVSAGDGEDGWRAWCEAENFGRLGEPGNNMVATEVILRDDARIKWIAGLTSFDAFCDKYVNKSLKPYLQHVDWPRVAEKYDGIIIAPYLYERRISQQYHHRWYYGWDVASGCIWHPRAVAELKPWKREDIAA